MAEGKVDLREDLVLVAKSDPESWAAKDQAASENSIPLSPQWLYANAKNSESKTSLSAAPGDSCPPNSLPQGTLVDSTQRGAWRLEGSQEKKDWRKNVPDIENSRRWHDEERETGMLGRRERRKEGDRESEYRKNDRRSDNVSMRETADSRPLAPSDRWNEVTSRNLGHESRRDSKWSSRWGPEGKEKDFRMDKKTETDKEDPHVEKQSVIGSNRPLPEPETRDKWKPRHRQEIFSGGPAVYRAAPGFGLEKGRVEGQNIGFAPGRGRANFSGSLHCSRSSFSGPIGAAPSIISDSLHGKSNLSAATFCYPRGKVLDIYRKNKMLSSFDSTPEGFEEVPQLTKLSSMAPLAFVKPDSEEVAVLEDIWKGKVISSEVHSDSLKESVGRDTDYVIEPDSNVGRCNDKVNALANEKDPGGITSAVSKNDACSNVPGGLLHSEKKDDQANLENNNGCVGLPDFLNDAKIGVSLDIFTKLPDDSNSLLVTPCIQESPGSDGQHQNNSRERELMEQVSSVELSLFYLDPQGNIQGPFLAEDIVSWYDEEFFGADLPVVLSDAPEGSPFRPLEEVIPFLSLRSQSASLINPGEQTEQSDTTRGNVEAIPPASSFSSSLALNGQQCQLSGTGGLFSHQVQPRISEPEASITSHYEMSPFSKPEISGSIPRAERQSSHDFSGQDSEEVLYMGRPVNTIQNPLSKPSNDIHDLSRASLDHQYLLTATGQANSTNFKVPINNDVNPLGLSWSELEGTHHRGPLSSNIGGVGDRDQTINPLVGGDAMLFRHKQEQFSAKSDHVVHDAWSGDNRRNASSNFLQDALDASHLARFDRETNYFNLEEHLISQQHQKQQLQQQHLMSSSHDNLHSSGSYLEQLQGPLYHQQPINQSIPHREHLLKLQLQQQRHLQQLEQDEQLHQQQLRHQMQLLQQHQQQQQQQQQHQQQQQQHQLFLEQFLHQNSKDPLRGEAALDPLLYKHHLLSVLQQQAHLLPPDHDPSLDQLIQAKFAQLFHPEQHTELLDSLAHPTHRHILPLEQQRLLGLQQEHLQARQFPFSSRQQPGMDDERHIGGVWSVDESGQFIRSAAGPRHTHTGRLGQSEFVQSLQRPSSFEQPSHLDQNFLLHDRMQRGNYGLNSHSFDRSAGAPRPDMELLSAWARLHGIDAHENHRVNIPGQMGQFVSGNHSHQNWMPDQFTALDAMERNWSESNGQLQNSLTESQFTKLHLAAEKQKRDMQASRFMENRNGWSSLVGNDESLNHGLPELLHQKLVLQSSLPLVNDPPTSSYENRDPYRLFSRPATDHSFNITLDKRGLDDPSADGPLFSKSGQTHQVRSMNKNLEGQADTFESRGRLPIRSSSGALAENKQLSVDIGGIEQEQLAHSMSGDMLRDRIDFSDRKEGMRVKQLGSKSISMNRYMLDSLEGGIEQSEASVIDHGDLKISGPVRHASFGGNGGGNNFYNYDREADNAYVDQMVNDRMSGIFSRGSDSSLMNLTHDQHNLSSQGALPEPVPVAPVKGKNSISFPYSDEIKREPGGSLAAPLSETSSSRKDVRFHRTSSYGDADAPEASFIDMLKGTRKQTPETDPSTGPGESGDAGPGGRSNSKKKGKKGRQIDPSLLGFKVHSNRIMMGEIQRPE